MKLPLVHIQDVTWFLLFMAVVRHLQLASRVNLVVGLSEVTSMDFKHILGDELGHKIGKLF